MTWAFYFNVERADDDKNAEGITHESIKIQSIEIPHFWMDRPEVQLFQV